MLRNIILYFQKSILLVCNNQQYSECSKAEKLILMLDSIVKVVLNCVPDIAINLQKMNMKYYSLAHVGMLLDHCPVAPQVLEAAPIIMYPSPHSYSAVL